MAHTHDRTLLASLGFQDPDKKDRRHTLACQYLCQPEVAMRVFWRIYPETEAMVRPPPTIPDETIEGARNAGTVWEPARPPTPLPEGGCGFRVTDMLTEVPILRGRDFLVGFWDVSLSARGLSPKRSIVAYGKETRDVPIEYGVKDYVAVFTKYHGHPPPMTQPCVVDVSATYRTTWVADHFKHICIEVKAGPTDVASIARQLATYQTYSMGCIGHVVATCYRMHPADKATLAAKGIHHIWLGEGFDAYCRARAEDAAMADDVDL